ncbi:MAG: hypothetical protein HY268_29945 [Deltaproteobacteria bacterium]|nr:hypothetical protein [Deltaproteobacteria bacterium]
MTDYYFDTSTLVKRYADESGSTWVRQITDPSAQHTILLAETTLAEVAAALAQSNVLLAASPRSNRTGF